MKRVFAFLADGFEETEAIAPVDILMRGGLEVHVVSLNEDYFATGAHRIPMVAAMNMEEFGFVELTAEDTLVFPGGMPGAANLAASKQLMKAMNLVESLGGCLAAICAAPAVVLASKMKPGVLEGLRMTCYDGFEDALKNAGAVYAGAKVETDITGSGATIVTAKGPGLAIDFGLAVLAALAGPDTAAKVAKGMML